MQIIMDRGEWNRRNHFQEGIICPFGQSLKEQISGMVKLGEQILRQGRTVTQREGKNGREGQRGS
jgi:hypothetical protein